VCNFRHGLASDPEDAARALFLLDLDYFREEVLDFDIEGQIRTLASFNEGACEIFAWTFPQSTRDSFGPEIPVAPRTEGQ
jgi:hypothetical protein